MKVGSFKGVLLPTLVIVSVVVLALSFSFNGIVSALPGGLTPHDPIYIDGNVGFTPANGVTSGSGTGNDPYVIENWAISAEIACGIWIKNTTAYFVIRNCYVHYAWITHGIHFENVKNGGIHNNLVEGNWCGIHLYSSDNNRIYHNNFINNMNQAYDDGSNQWDDGYPSGGNYWSDYMRVDENHGENQDLPGPDKIGDIPYNIPGGNNQDRYPLMYTDSPKLVPCLPPWPDTVRLEPTSIGGNAYVKVWMAFPTGGYDVDWGSVTRIDDSTFSADAKIWVWTGPVTYAVTLASHVYDLGALPPGVYRFIFKAWGTPIKSLQFTHPLGLENALRLVTLYEVNLDVDLWLDNNSKLVVKFYTWGDDFEGENVVWSGPVPDNVILLEDIPHPQGKAVEKARLDLTHDNTENVISTIASYTVRRVDLNTRFTKIPGEWFLAPPPERMELETEFSAIPGKWFLAPS